MKSDYLKYWRPIKYFIKRKYGVSETNLDVLLFLYSEKYFMLSDLRKYNEIVPWCRERFDNLLRDGFVEVFRDFPEKRGRIYRLTRKSTRMIASLYSKLEGNDIPMTHGNNPMFKKKTKYTDKVYRNYIKDLNEKRKQERFSDNDGL
jgi:hypothetical protein